LDEIKGLKIIQLLFGNFQWHFVHHIIGTQ
jgi:hypothetical protein